MLERNSRSMIAYLHHYPVNEKEIGTKWFHTPMPMDCSNCGYYSDRIYNMNSETKRFYVATFGFEKAWKEHNIIDRMIYRYTLHFVFDGKALCNGHPIKAGEVFIVPQNQKYSIVHNPQVPLTLAWIAISGTELENQLSLLRLPDFCGIMTYQNAEKIHDIFIDTVYEPHSGLDLELYLFSIFYKVLALSQITTTSAADGASSTADIYFSEIMSYINTHYSDDIRVADIARHIHISPTYLHRICTQRTGKSPHELIDEKKIGVAKSMLSNSNASIGEISRFIGFSNPNTFSKFFAKNCGCSATDYRQQQQGKRKQTSEDIVRTEKN